jgi:hypothetical protein
MLEYLLFLNHLVWIAFNKGQDPQKYLKLSLKKFCRSLLKWHTTIYQQPFTRVSLLHTPKSHLQFLQPKDSPSQFYSTFAPWMSIAWFPYLPHRPRLFYYSLSIYSPSNSFLQPLLISFMNIGPNKTELIYQHALILRNWVSQYHFCHIMSYRLSYFLVVITPQLTEIRPLVQMAN